MKMPMTEMQICDQTVRYDRDATAAVYGTLEHGGAEECGCVFCKNFTVQRDLVYPASFKALLERLGIDPHKEGEVFEYGPVEDGCHLYGGWFYFVGEMVRWGERNSNAPDSHQFEFFFTSIGPNAPAFRGGPRLTIEFTTHVKWVLPNNPDSGRHPAVPGHK
jgi:hypothetical protein